jgi:membrane fusion protein (multidrug efflux system)
MVRLGASVTPGQTLLNTISSDDPIAAILALIRNLQVHTAADEKAVKGDSTFVFPW